MSPLFTLAIRIAVHSTVAAAVVELLLASWRVSDPRVRYRMRLPALVLPPLTALLAPLAARLGFPSLLRTGPWREMRLGAVAADHFAAGLFLAMVTIFIVQELLPFLRDRRRASTPRPVTPAADSRLGRAIAEVFGAPAVPCYEVPSRARLLSVQRIDGRDALVFGEGFPDWLDDEELRAVLAHERAHVLRRDLAGRRWLYRLRVLQIHAPFALVEYRQLVNDSEEIADAMSVAQVGAPMALGAGLLKAHGTTAPPPRDEKMLATAARRVEHGARRVRLLRRVKRLLSPRSTEGAPPAAALVISTIALAALLLGIT